MEGGRSRSLSEQVRLERYHLAASSFSCEAFAWLLCKLFLGKFSMKSSLTELFYATKHIPRLKFH